MNSGELNVMDDVTRLFRALVMHLAEHDPRRLSAPFQISELYQSLIPYRLFKSELQFDSMEDYEMAILRLLAGEHQLVALEPADVQDVLRTEADAVVPDTGAFRDFAGALMALRADAVRGFLEEGSAYAPPASMPAEIDPTAPRDNDAPTLPPVADFATFTTEPSEPQLDPSPSPALQRPGPGGPAPPADAASSLVFEAVDAPATCPSCTRPLPEDRTVTFCPFCGTLVTTGTCPRCGDTIEPTWRYCGTCGQPAAG